MKPSPVAQNDMPKAKLSQGKAPEMDNEAKMSGYERSTVTNNRNPHQDKAVDSDANEPPGKPQRGRKVPRAAQAKVTDGDTKKAQGEPQRGPKVPRGAQVKVVDGDTKKPRGEPQRGPKFPRAAQVKVVHGDTKKPRGEPQRGPEIRCEGYERPIPATNINAQQDKAIDGDAIESPAEPQASPEILRKAQDYGQPTPATNMNPHQGKAVDRGTKKSRVKAQRWPEIAEDFGKMLNMGLNRMLGIFGTLCTLFVTLAPLLPKVLVLFALINIFHAAFESACEIPLVP